MNKFLIGFVALALALCVSSCEKEENVFLIVTDPLAAQCTDNGVWSACYSNTSGFDLDGIHFSHFGATEPYEQWRGFCPSTVRDTKEYDTDEWVEHQWATIAGHSARGNFEDAYLVAYWDGMLMDDGTNTTGLPGSNSCVVTGTDGITFMPYDVYVSNTTWGYYAMKNGTPFSKAFTGEDWFKLTITGYRKGLVTSSVDVMLAEKGYINPDWIKVRLSRLGLVDMMVFDLSSSDTGEWGINTPTFFCIDALHMH